VQSDVTTPSNLFDYFNSHIQDAAEATGANLTPDTQLYLATLLTDRVRSDDDRVSADTLAEIHALAANSRPGERARAYRELGDRALYSVGYFTEHCTRRTVNERYYLDMGSAAYYQVDQVFKRWFADAFGHVFKELAERFLTCVDVVKAVRETHRDDDIIALYERWLATGSTTLASKLHTKGLLLPTKSYAID
jgi:hypothetical protein